MTPPGACPTSSKTPNGSRSAAGSAPSSIASSSLSTSSSAAGTGAATHDTDRPGTSRAYESSNRNKVVVTVIPSRLRTRQRSFTPGPGHPKHRPITCPEPGGASRTNENADPGPASGHPRLPMLRSVVDALVSAAPTAAVMHGFRLDADSMLWPIRLGLSVWLLVARTADWHPILPRSESAAASQAWAKGASLMWPRSGRCSAFSGGAELRDVVPCARAKPGSGAHYAAALNGPATLGSGDVSYRVLWPRCWPALEVQGRTISTVP